MRIQVYYKGQCLTLAYITQTKNTLIGWFASKVINIEFVNPIVEKRDFHITYPRDGNAHFSYKYFDPISRLNFEKRVYFDEVVLKKFNENMEFISFEKQPRNDDDLDQHLAIKIKPKPLDENFESFMFPTTATIIDDRFLEKINEKCTPLKKDDIRLDVENLEGVLNMGFIIYSGNEGDFPIKSELVTDLKLMKVSENIFVGGYVLVAK